MGIGVAVRQRAGKKQIKRDKTGGGAEPLLKEVTGFGATDERTVKQLLDRSELISVPRGAAVFNAGERPSALYLVLSGSIKLILPRRVPERETVVALLRKGELFDIPSLFVQGSYAVSAVAAASSRLARFPKKMVFEAMRENPQLGYALVKGLSRRVYELLVQVRGAAALGTSTYRLIKFVAGELPDAVQTGSATITLPASKRAVAARLAVRPEHLSRVLRGLTSIGLISVNGREITIHDVRRLREYARSDTMSSRGRGAGSGRQRRLFRF